ncbi:hypothetical protein BDP67DRAFT_167010 [Colletotrichum lupini]|nr:hypothetical protein BDP67DRAFT_167010 [Colletotrichum lupini]
MNAPTLVQNGPAIQIAAHSCDDKLSDMIKEIHGGKTALRELQQRFQAWTNNSGVFAEPRFCLDARLCDHQRPQMIILMLLNLIQDNLDTARINVVDVQTEKPETESGSEPGTNHSHKSPYHVSGIGEARRNADMDYLEVAFNGVSGALERLNHVAALITKSSRASRPIRMEKYIKEHQNEMYDMEGIIKDIVSSKFPDIHASLKAQITRSLIYRRQRLDYDCSRQDRLYNTRTKEADTLVQQDEEKASTFHGSLFSEGMRSEVVSRTAFHSGKVHGNSLVEAACQRGLRTVCMCFGGVCLSSQNFRQVFTLEIAYGDQT